MPKIYDYDPDNLIQDTISPINNRLSNDSLPLNWNEHKVYIYRFRNREKGKFGKANSVLVCSITNSKDALGDIYTKVTQDQNNNSYFKVFFDESLTPTFDTNKVNKSYSIDIINRSNLSGYSTEFFSPVNLSIDTYGLYQLDSSYMWCFTIDAPFNELDYFNNHQNVYFMENFVSDLDKREQEYVADNEDDIFETGQAISMDFINAYTFAQSMNSLKIMFSINLDTSKLTYGDDYYLEISEMYKLIDTYITRDQFAAAFNDIMGSGAWKRWVKTYKEKPILWLSNDQTTLGSVAITVDYNDRKYLDDIYVFCNNFFEKKYNATDLIFTRPIVKTVEPGHITICQLLLPLAVFISDGSTRNFPVEGEDIFNITWVGHPIDSNLSNLECKINLFGSELGQDCFLRAITYGLFDWRYSDDTSIFSPPAGKDCRYLNVVITDNFTLPTTDTTFPFDYYPDSAANISWNTCRLGPQTLLDSSIDYPKFNIKGEVILKFNDSSLIQQILPLGTRQLQGIDIDVQYDVISDLVPFKVAPDIVNDQLLFYSDWQDYKRALPLNTQVLLARGSKSTNLFNGSLLSLFIDPSTSKGYINFGREASQCLADMILLTYLTGTGFKDCPSIDQTTSVNYGSLNETTLIGYQGMRLADLNKGSTDKVSLVDKVYINLLSTGITPSDTAWYIFHGAICALSRYISSSLAIAEGISLFGTIYLPFTLTFQNPIQLDIVPPKFDPNNKTIQTEPGKVRFLLAEDNNITNPNINGDSQSKIVNIISSWYNIDNTLGFTPFRQHNNVREIITKEIERTVSFPIFPDQLQGIQKSTLPGDISTMSNKDLAYITWISLPGQKDFELFYMKNPTSSVVPSDTIITIPSIPFKRNGNSIGVIPLNEEEKVQFITNYVANIYQITDLSQIEVISTGTLTLSNVLGSAQNFCFYLNPELNKDGDPFVFISKSTEAHETATPDRGNYDHWWGFRVNSKDPTNPYDHTDPGGPNKLVPKNNLNINYNVVFDGFASFAPVDPNKPDIMELLIALASRAALTADTDDFSFISRNKYYLDANQPLFNLFVAGLFGWDYTDNLSPITYAQFQGPLNFTTPNARLEPNPGMYVWWTGSQDISTGYRVLVPYVVARFQAIPQSSTIINAQVKVKIPVTQSDYKSPFAYFDRSEYETARIGVLQRPLGFDQVTIKPTNITNSNVILSSIVVRATQLSDLQLVDLQNIDNVPTLVTLPIFVPNDLNESTAVYRIIFI